eukprot:CAMPEP_0168213442 /NCGR_PEP_ID=MMETSP0140_2-20121125/4798_1 /TAXON_ID=44445 /ORGANISM="Pseudo-nitzschia australis, Strain 10249 10 AB" /LENGTH=134 /DNA_ID=CAMNT_0008140295 /DNA_START=1072 /DNA_END=1476 /DNA_ORIENTATION=-
MEDKRGKWTLEPPVSKVLPSDDADSVDDYYTAYPVRVFASYSAVSWCTAYGFFGVRVPVSYRIVLGLQRVTTICEMNLRIRCSTSTAYRTRSIFVYSAAVQVRPDNTDPVRAVPRLRDFVRYGSPYGMDVIFVM